MSKEEKKNNEGSGVLRPVAHLREGR